MTNDDPNATPAPKGRRGPELTSALALAVSIFALAIGAWQTRLMQSQARASVWPHLEIGYTYNSNVDDNAFLWRIDNNGVGPARIETIALTFDGKPMRHWSDAITALGFDGAQHTSTSSLAGEVIPPSLNRETAIEALRVNQRELAAAIKQNATRFGMEICYCSVYDDCWVAHWLKPKPDPVARCEASSDNAFDD
ncbi:MAG TPA: hypothetical protein VFV97_14245 [Rhodanobacteraceae bacterium]|nr:hypothetical protein [Rhodanobacteraceae bacterium]